MDVCEIYSERSARGAHGINSHVSRGVCNLNSHVPKEFACEGPRGQAGDLKQYTCPACPKLTQNVSPMNCGIKSMNNNNIYKYTIVPLNEVRQKNYSIKLIYLLKN